MRVLLLPLLLWSSVAAGVQVDGHIDAAEWAGAQHITDFRLTQPLTRATSPYPTEAWVLATPQGLAIAFHCIQPASVPRTRQRTQRDQGAQVDRVNLVVDFDGDGRTGYNFMVTLSDGIQDEVVTNENQFNPDWDGNWKHAVSEDGDSWSVEMLIPWYIAPMHKGNASTRTIGLYLDRVIGSTGERVAWPTASFEQTRYLSDFNRVQVPRYSQSLLAITPYASAVYDNVRGQLHTDTGADIFWKPNGQMQLTATLNPDFGQVESDDLVVNFSAVETFFSDKRPFFTENQGYFDDPFGALGNADRLLYTRRVGGPADDGKGSGDVTAALKLNGSIGGLAYGVFAATEAGAAGRDFYAVRATHTFADTAIGEQDFGAMLSRVHRPFLDRDATVLSFDHTWRPNARLSIRSKLVGSDIVQAGATTRDTGFQVRADYDMGKGWRQQLYALHLGANLQLNDFGYLERNNFNYLRYEIDHRATDLPKESQYASHDWHYAASTRYSDRGVHIADAVAIERQSELRDGGSEFFTVSLRGHGHDDLVTRGNGVVKVPENLYSYIERSRPRRGHWAFFGSLSATASGLKGIRGTGLEAYLEPTYFITDNLSFFTGVRGTYAPDQLIWQHDNLLGSFRIDQLTLNAGLQWTIGSKQELRLKLESIGLGAHLTQAWRVAPDGTPMAVDEPVSDFALRNLGFQVRYRYELAPLSDLFIVYARGGSLFEQNGLDATDEFRNAFDLRNNEQLLVKLSYRFEI
jgi:hypothetical protein